MLSSFFVIYSFAMFGPDAMLVPLPLSLMAPQLIPIPTLLLPMPSDNELMSVCDHLELAFERDLMQLEELSLMEENKMVRSEQVFESEYRLNMEIQNMMDIEELSRENESMNSMLWDLMEEFPHNFDGWSD